MMRKPPVRTASSGSVMSGNELRMRTASSRTRKLKCGSRRMLVSRRGSISSQVVFFALRASRSVR